MTDRPTITAALMTLNEAENLRRLLPELDWVDQIVVVDSGSSDETLSIAQAHGCLIEQREMDNFAAQRNRAIELSSGDWILSIDADETPSPRLVREILQRIGTSLVSAFHVPIRSTIFGRPLRRSGTQNDNPVRLFRRDRALWEGDVHEVLSVDGRIGQMNNWLVHVTTPDLATFLSKMHRYALLEATARVEAGRGPRRIDSWLAPPREIFRRLFWKQGLLDGPAGWSFCLLSGLSEWVIAREHRRLWDEAARKETGCHAHACVGMPSDEDADRGTHAHASVSMAPDGYSVVDHKSPFGPKGNDDTDLLLPLMLDHVPASLTEALRQEGVPARAVEEPGQPSRFVLFDSRNGPCRKAEWQTAIDVDELRHVCPGDPFEKLDNTSSAPHQWLAAGLVVCEEIATVDRRATRQNILREIRRRVEKEGGVWLSVDAFPFPYRGVMNLRVDYDQYNTTDFDSLLRGISGNEHATSHFICGSAYEAHPDALARLRGLDIGSHGFHHHTYLTAEENLENIRRSVEVLRTAGIEPSGFAAPGGRYNDGLAAALEILQPSFSGEFGLAYDELPFTPSGRGVLQIPIHPLCLGVCIEALSGEGAVQSDGTLRAVAAAAAYFRETAGKLYDSGCPMFFYGHPTGRLGRYPEVIRAIFEATDLLPAVWKTTLSEFAAWWKQRAEISLSVTRQGEALQVGVGGTLQGHRQAVLLHEGDRVARVPVENDVLRISPSALEFEKCVRRPVIRPVRVSREDGLRGRIRRMIDWELETPVEEIEPYTWRNRVKKTLRQLHSQP